MTRPITSRQGLTGTLWIIFLHRLGMLSFTKPGEEVELSELALISPKVEEGWVFRKELLTATPGELPVHTASSSSLQLVSALLLRFLKLSKVVLGHYGFCPTLGRMPRDCAPPPGSPQEAEPDSTGSWCARVPASRSELHCVCDNLSHLIPDT